MMKYAWLLALGFSSPLLADGIEQLSTFNKNLQTMQVQFTQTIYDSHNKETQKAYGQAWLQRPGKFRWDYTAPYSQELVSDGKNFWLYDTDLDQVTVKPISDALGSAPIFLLMKPGVLNEKFNSQDLGQENDLEWVQLVPKVQDTDYSKVLIGMSHDQIRQMKLVDAFGQTTLIEFSGVVINQAINAAKFNFQPPAGVDMVGEAAP